MSDPYIKQLYNDWHTLAQFIEKEMDITEEAKEQELTQEGLEDEPYDGLRPEVEHE